MADEAVDRREPKLVFGKVFEPGTIGVGRHIKVKAPDRRECASVPFGLYDDEPDSALFIPATSPGKQCGPKSPPAPLRTPDPQLLMSDHEGRAAKPDLARSPADDLTGLIGDHPQADQPARPTWQPHLAAQELRDLLPRLRDLDADIALLEMQTSERKGQIPLQQPIPNEPQSAIVTVHLKPSASAGSIQTSCRLVAAERHHRTTHDLTLPQRIH